MVTILQYVTTYPIELMECPRLATKEDTENESPKTDKKDIKDFYLKDITSYNNDDNLLILPEPSTTPTLLKKPKNILDYNGPINDTTLSTLKAIGPNEPNIKKIKNNYIDYNIIYNKLFEHNLNYIEKFSKNKTIIIFPTHEKSDNGKSDLKKEFYPFYIDKFDKIQTIVNFKTNENVCYIDLKVYSTKSKDEYKKSINFEFNRIKDLIKTYNDNIKQLLRIGRSSSENLEIKNIIFILDLDKKNLFTGIYNRPLAKDKKEILAKEYYSFLSSQDFTTKSVEDSTITLTYKDLISQLNIFKGMTGMTISLKDLPKEAFENFILLLKNKYRQIIDKEFRKSLKETDNVKKLSIFYRLKNVDKEIDDTILTGPNKIYTLKYKNEKGEIYDDLKGYFTLISKERGIYNFIEDTNFYRQRKAKIVKLTGKVGEENSKPQPEPIEEEHTNIENITNNEPIIESAESVGKQNKNVKIKYKYGKLLYETINDPNTIGKKGEVTDLIDKVSIEKFKWFRPKDLDLSLSEEKKIKYYDDILFDKNTLIEYLKYKKRYTDKTNISYEFLKINDSSELIEYCDFIHANFKNNIKEIKFNPFKPSFNPSMIKNNIVDIIFQPNNIIYTQALTKTTEEQRDSSTKDNYKIVDKKIYDYKDKTGEDICNIININIDKTNDTDCSKTYTDYINQPLNKGIEHKFVVVSITKMNIKDIGLLKKKVECKTKKINIKHKYKQLYKFFTQKIGNYMIDPYKGGKLKTKRKGKTKTRKNKIRRQLN